MKKGGKMGVIFFVTSFIVTEDIKKVIEEKDFILVPTGYTDIYDLYIGAKKRNEPILVTMDLILHTLHLSFDYSLRGIEVEILLPKLKKLTENMYQLALKSYKSSPTSFKFISERVLAFFGVACRLLDLNVKLPQEVDKLVDKELTFINAAQGMATSPIFGYREDYTQYIVRGHYTQNLEFEQFFKTMMWYGRMGFYINPSPSMYLKKINPKEEGIKLTQMSLLIVKWLKENPELLKLWEKIYNITTKFVGKADDYTVIDYKDIMEGVDLQNKKSVIKFIEKVKLLPPPMIVSTATEDTLGLRGFKFMGQRFIPDSYIFQNLVYPRVLNYLGKQEPFTMGYTTIGKTRTFPRGLDIMYVLGNSVAGDILKVEGDTEYKNYNIRVEEMQGFVKNLPKNWWKSTIYWRWFYIFRRLASHKHEGYPRFMKTKRWIMKELLTLLGAWTELRHDTILYSKQSYTLLGTALPPKPKFVMGWVEPYPEVYRLIKELVEELEKYSPSIMRENLNKFSTILEKLSKISEKELKKEELEEEEYRLIQTIGEKLKEVVSFPSSFMAKISKGEEKNMAIIADVHTDSNSEMVLEEAIGYPYFIFLKLSSGKIVKGGVFSYYEFKVPMNERYTDEKWRATLKTTPPSPPKWVVENLLIKE